MYLVIAIPICIYGLNKSCIGWLTDHNNISNRNHKQAEIVLAFVEYETCAAIFSFPPSLLMAEQSKGNRAGG